MPKRIALFANGKVGLEIARFLAEQEDEVVVLSLANQYPTFDYEIEKALSDNLELRKYFGDLRNDIEDFKKILNSTQVDTIITVYWPYLLPTEILNSNILTINFHPALLPLNRGWYPHVHNILDGSPAGVTLHKISDRPDEGDIWLQKEVPTYPWDLASDLYTRLQSEIFSLFTSNWHLISSGKIDSFPQPKDKGNYHSKNEIEKLDYLDLNRSYKVSELLNLLRARTFGENGFAYFVHEGQRIKVRLEFKREDV